MGRYVSNVLKHWTADALDGRFERVTLYTPTPVDRLAIGLPPTVEARVIGPHWRQLPWQNLRLAPAVRDDVLFCPSYSRPIIVRGKTVVTIFEATQKLHPELYPRQARLIYSPLYGFGARRSAFVITSSEAAARDIEASYGVDPSLLRVVHLAAAEEFGIVDDAARIEAARQRYSGSNAPFFLYVGKLTGRRNIPKLMEAFSEFRRRTSSEHRLVLVGMNTTQLPLADLAQRWGISDVFRHYEYVADADLILLYNAAEAFVLPYTYEAAFSLTAIEAQATGTPLITIDAPGLRESTGSAALFIPDAGVREIAEAMERIAGDDALRLALRERGLENAGAYSWTRTSHETLGVLCEAAQVETGR